MRKLLATYRQFIGGIVVGGVVVTFFVWMSSSGTEPFQHIPYIVRNVNGDTLVKTPRFTVLYRGVDGTNAASSMTIAGRNEGLSELWNGGAVSGWGGSEKGIAQMALYDEDFGVATFIIDGEIIRVTNSATQLQVAGSVFDISTSAPNIVVDRNKQARLADWEVYSVLNAIDAGDKVYAGAAAPRPQAG